MYEVSLASGQAHLHFQFFLSLSLSIYFFHNAINLTLLRFLHLFSSRRMHNKCYQQEHVSCGRVEADAVSSSRSTCLDVKQRSSISFLSPRPKKLSSSLSQRDTASTLCDSESTSASCILLASGGTNQRHSCKDSFTITSLASLMRFVQVKSLTRRPDS